MAMGWVATTIAATSAAKAACAFLAMSSAGLRGADIDGTRSAHVLAPVAADPSPAYGVAATSAATADSAGAAPASVASFAGMSSPAVLASSSLVTAIALAAAQARAARRRRRRVATPAPPSDADSDADVDGASSVTAEGRQLTGIAAEIATGLSMTDADRRRRKEKRDARKDRMRMKQTNRNRSRDPAIQELLEGEDPQFFGIPFIWVQLGHAVMSLTAIAVSIFGEADTEFALFDLAGPYIAAVRSGTSNVLIVNVLLAGVTAFDEFKFSGLFINALGWGLKTLLIGGVATWQRTWRMTPKDDEEAGGAKVARARG